MAATHPHLPVLDLLASRPRYEDVHYHSVIGVTAPNNNKLERWLAGTEGEIGDGVVPSRSAHLDCVDSELVVDADHFTVHHHPRSVLEVRQILLEHLRCVAPVPPGTPVAAAP